MRENTLKVQTLRNGTIKSTSLNLDKGHRVHNLGNHSARKLGAGRDNESQRCCFSLAAMIMWFNFLAEVWEAFEGGIVPENFLLVLSGHRHNFLCLLIVFWLGSDVLLFLLLLYCGQQYVCFKYFVKLMRVSGLQQSRNLENK